LLTAVLVPFLTVALVSPIAGLRQGGRLGFVSEASAAESRDAPRPGLVLFPLAKRGQIGAVVVARIEEYLRGLLEAGTKVRVLSDKEAQLQSGPGKRKAQTAASRELDAADAELLEATDLLAQEEDKPRKEALARFEKCIERYEKNFEELIDFNKLVDAYGRAAEALVLTGGSDKEARKLLTRAIVLQPTFVVDARKAPKRLVDITTEVRKHLDEGVTTAVSVECNQPKANIFIDGVLAGNSPVKQEGLYKGTHYLQVRLEGAKPWGKRFETKGKSMGFKVNIEVEDAGGEDTIDAQVGADDLKPYSKSGEYHLKLFRNTARFYAQKVRADFLLFGLVTKDGNDYVLSLFLFRSQGVKTWQLDKITFDPDLSNLQLQLLSVDDMIAKTAARPSASQEVKAIPDVYKTPDVAGGGVKPDVKPDHKPDLKPDIKPDVKPDTRPDRKPDLKPDKPYVPPDDDQRPITRKAWFWVIVGTVAVGAAAGIILATTGKELPAKTFNTTAVLP